MFDEKILMILAPVWLATVAVTLVWGVIRPKSAKIVAALLESGCQDAESAKSLKELGITAGQAFLKQGSAMRRVVSVAEFSGEPRYYISPEHKDKAEAMYGKANANIWQALLWSLGLTVFFFLLWLLGSLVLDTTGWKPLFRI